MKSSIYTVRYKCGHTGEVQLFCHGAELDRRLKEFAAKDCTDCERKAERELVDAFNAKYDAPQLQGSVKQIAWAEVLRYRLCQNMLHIESKSFLEFVKDFRNTEFYTTNENGEQVPTDMLIRRLENEEKRNAPIVKEFMKQHRDAAWYINYRSSYNNENFIFDLLPPVVAAVKKEATEKC